MPVGIKDFTVSGRGPFPMDMLRYDSAWPADTTDAHAITDTFAVEYNRRWEINIRSSDRMAPCVARWDSFNVKVIKQ